MAASFGARGILEAIKIVREIEETGKIIGGAESEVEDAMEILDSIPDIDLGPADDADDVFNVERADEAIDGTIEEGLEVYVRDAV